MLDLDVAPLDNLFFLDLGRLALLPGLLPDLPGMRMMEDDYKPWWCSSRDKRWEEEEPW